MTTLPLQKGGPTFSPLESSLLQPPVCYWFHLIVVIANATCLACTRRIQEIAKELALPKLEEMLRRFLYEELTGSDDAQTVELATCPSFTSRLSLYHSATATFFAPSEISGNGGMHTEVIRANPDWRGESSRFDTVLVQTDSEGLGIKGTRVARVLAFFSVPHPQKAERIACALVEWFSIQGAGPSSVTGMWVVKPTTMGGRRVRGIIHLDTIIRSVHLLPVF